MKRLSEALLLLLATLFAACDTYEQDAYRQEYVVEAYLVAGEPLPVVKLSHTAPLRDTYDFDRVAVEDARVTVSVLDASGQALASHVYRPVSKGRYGPAEDTVVVRPLTRYRLEVEVPGLEQPIRSETLVPGGFHLTGINADTVVYQGAAQFEARVTPSVYPGRQTIYVFTIEALDTVRYGLTPYYQDLVDTDDSDVTRADLVKNSAGISNAANFDTAPDGTLQLRLPWIVLAFFGPTRITANAIDDNLYDFYRSQGGGSTSPGEMQNLIDHVDNGRGVFGSMTRDQIDVFVQPP